ncbi:conserved hypothetical protein [Tenacibaculum litopenaei]|uniref:hypothetical protein n=1 Tax=Tenacibaculum litopenaei TaxID=396016 RepID=UPI0038951A40
MVAQCGDLFAEGSITVIPQSTVDNLNKSESLCVGTLLTTIEHSVSGVTGLGTPENLPSGVAARLVGGTTVEITGTPSESGVFNYRIPLTAQCGNLFAEGSITVLPQSTVDNLDKSQSLCVGTLLTNIEHSVSGVTGLGTSENLPSGVAARLVGGTTVEITGTPSESGVFNYRIPLTAQCGDLFAEGSITVIPQSTVDNVDKSQRLCVGSLLTTIEHSVSGVTGLGTPENLPSGVEARLVGGTTVEITGTPSVSGVFNYRIPLKAQCGDLFAEGSITVIPQSTVDNVDKSQSLCVGTLLTTIEHSVSGVTGLGTPENLPSGVAARLVGGTTVEITGSPLESGVFDYRIPLIAQCGDLFVEGKITVFKNNTVSTGSSQPEVFYGDHLPVITHKTTGINKMISVKGLPRGVTAQWKSGLLEINGIPVQSGVFNYSISMEGNCGVSIATGIIKVRNKLEVRADDFMHSSFKPGDTTSSVLANDTLNGQMVELGNGPDEVSMFLVKSSNVLELNNDGTIFIKKDIPSGIYKLRYELCDHSSLQSCKQGEVTIRIQRVASS